MSDKRSGDFGSAGGYNVPVASNRPMDMLSEIIDRVAARHKQASERMGMATTEQARAQEELNEISAIHEALTEVRLRFQGKPAVERVSEIPIGGYDR